MELEKLRNRLSELDRRIVELIAERRSVVAEVGAAKLADGQATRDFTREKQVIDAARSQATALGLSADLAERLMQLLIRFSLTDQEQARVRAEGQGQGRKALVIGGGKMGQWFVNFLDSQGFDMTVADPVVELSGFICVKDWRTTGDHFAVTLIAAPLRVTANILQEMAAIGRKGLIFDIGSLKSPLIGALRTLAANGARVTSIHPMFGPDTRLLSGKHVLFLDAGSEQATREARALFDSTMVQQTEMALEEHDRMIAYVLGLSHALNIAFFEVLANSGEDVPSLANLSSTTFDAQLEVASRVAGENPQLYFEIQSLNQYGLEPLHGLRRAIDAITESVRAGDEEAFVKLMERGQRYLMNRD
jgi:chorismate mutase/prephenate dehydrogenase